MPFRVVIVRTARAQITAERRRWRQHYPVSWLDDDLEKAISALAGNPEAGSADPRYADVRRILLQRTRFYLYYRVDRVKRIVRISAFWHTSRGSGPPL